MGEEGGCRWFGLVLSWSWGAGVSWGYLEKNKSSFCHDPGGVGVPGGTWGKNKNAHEIHACEMHTNEVHAYDMYVHEVHTRDIVVGPVGH